MAKKKTKIKDLYTQVMEMKERGEKLLLKKRRFLGYDTGFPLLNLAIDGIQNELYILAGASAMGKTTFLTQICWQLAENNHDLHVIFLSLDQSSLDITAKFVGQLGEIPVDYVQHPFPIDEELDEGRIGSIFRISELKDRITIIDDSDFSIDDLDSLIKKMNKDGIEDICVLIDPALKLHKMNEGEDFIHAYRNIFLSLKRMCRKRNCGIITSFGLSHAAELKRAEKKNLLEIPELLSLSYSVMILHTDYMNDFDTPFLEWDWSGRDIIVPISEINIIKNKMNFFRGRIFYKFFASFAKYRECIDEENQNYNEMIGNIGFHKDKEKRKDRMLLEKQLLKDDKVDV